MEQKTKYEIRSNEVQEVMSRPPHFIVNWGNILIVLTMIIAAILMNKIQLKTKEHLLGTFLSPNSNHSANQLVFSLTISPEQKIRPGSSASVNILGNNGINLGTFDTTVDSLWRNDGKVLIALKMMIDENQAIHIRDNRILNPSKGMQVSIDIITGKEKVFEAMLRKLRIK